MELVINPREDRASNCHTGLTKSIEVFPEKGLHDT